MNLPQIDNAQQIKKILDFISHTFSNAGKNNAVIALSGGVDSATSLFLTAKALDPKNIHCFHLPSKTSNPVNATHAQEATQAAGIPAENFTLIPIGSIIQKTWRIITKTDTGVFTNAKDTPNRKVQSQEVSRLNRLRLANIAARIRMIAIYDQAKKHNALVIGTENYSEHLLGYFTRYGDEASDLEPIRNLYKTQVFELAKSLGVPQDIIDKAPSADLWIGQSDEKELGFSYAQADPILHLYDQGNSQEDIISQGHDPELVHAVLHSVHTSHFKHQVPYLPEA